MRTRSLCSLSVAACFLALTGCVTNPEIAPIIAQPKTPIARTVTNFDQAKGCMDNLFKKYGKTNYPITTGDIYDQTGNIRAGMQDMIISALDDMSLRSKAFKFVIIDNSDTVIFIRDRISQGVQARALTPPRHYIRGSVSQVDRNVATDRQSAGLSTTIFGAGYGADQSTSIVAIDLQMADLVSKSVLPGVTTSNTITVVSKGQGVSAEGLINDGAISIDLSRDRTEGTGQAVRTLLEYSLIELLGKFTKIPYARCLELDSTLPTARADLREIYDDLTDVERTAWIQRGLQYEALYGGDINGKNSREFRTAINIAKSKRSLNANGRVDFDIFAAFVDDGLIPRELPESDGAVDEDELDIARLNKAADPETTPEAGHDPLGLLIRAPQGRLRVGDSLTFSVSTEKDANVFCYYEFVDGDKYRTVRVFPNRFRKSSRIYANKPISIPAKSDGFEIELAAVGVDEGIACIATALNYQHPNIPRAVEEPDLTPLKTSQRLYGVVDQHTNVDTWQTSVEFIRFKAR